MGASPGFLLSHDASAQTYVPIFDGVVLREFAMAEQYFVKRGETVKGPFSLKKIQQLEAAKKLKANDLIGTNESGPWERVTAYNRILSSAQRGTIPVVATIEAWRVKRGLLGQFQVNFKCPGCKAELK